VFLGNLVEVKNLARLIEAFAALHGDGRAGGLALVGDGPLRATLGDHARALGVSGAVHFAGEVARDEAPRWLRAADVVCLPSLREGLGLAALEGLASGRAVVVSRTAGAAAAVTEAVGALCDPRDVGSIAEAIEAASALVPGPAAIAAAAPYALDREAGRLEALLQAVAAEASPKLRS
jgi:glycogen(starch) synthase